MYSHFMMHGQKTLLCHTVYGDCLLAGSGWNSR